PRRPRPHRLLRGRGTDPAQGRVLATRAGSESSGDLRRRLRGHGSGRGRATAFAGGVEMSIELANGRTIPAEAKPAGPARPYAVQAIEPMARHAAASRLFGMDQAQAFTLMLIAQSEGLDPIQAMKRYHVIQGRPAMRADAMQAEFQRQG